MKWNKAYIWNLVKKAMLVIFWLGLVTGLLVSVSFTYTESDKVVCKNVHVTWKETDQLLISRELLLQTAIGVPSDTPLLGKQIAEIQIADIERRLNQNALIEQSEVFTDLNGTLHIEVVQREPILRVINLEGDAFYMDKSGYKMPLSPVYTAHVPIASGAIAESYSGSDTLETFTLKSVVKIATYVDKQPFWKAQIEQIFVRPTGEIILIPKIGNHMIRFGNTEHLETKFDNLLVFYKEGLNRVGWSKYKELDVRFANQVIGKK